MKNDRFRENADLLLGSLTWKQADTNRVLSELKGDQPIMKRKMSMGLALVLSLVLLAAVALAGGLLYSPRYSAVRLANRALETTYGITPDMMTILYRDDSAIAPNGSGVVKYYSIESQWAEKIGVYTVTVWNGRAEAMWSHHGQPITSGLDSSVWGPEQLNMIMDDYSAVFRETVTTTAPLPTPDPIQMATEAERREHDAQLAKNMAKVSLADARAIALQAISQEYLLTNAQIAAMWTDDEYGVYYKMMNGEPVVEVIYVLSQSDDGEFVEGDGQYWVTVNLESGLIEDILYDSGRAGNG